MTASALSIIIPAYNEEKTIHLILDKVKEVQLIMGIQKQVIVVNDCSSDDTKGAVETYMSKNTDLEKINLEFLPDYINENSGQSWSFIARILLQTQNLLFFKLSWVFVNNPSFGWQFSKAKEWPKSCLCDLNRRVIGQSNEQVPFKWWHIVQDKLLSEQTWLA